MLEDYAFLIAALIDIYQIDYEIHYLEAAQKLTDRMIALFWDKESQGFFATATPPIHFADRQKDFDDNAISSANSVAAMNLMRLARILRNQSYAALTGQLLAAVSTQMIATPLAYPSLLLVLDFNFGAGLEFVLVEGRSPEDAQKIDRLIKSKYLTNSVTISRPFTMNKESAEYQLMPWLLDMPPEDSQMRLYACENFTCKLPLDGYEQAEKFISALVRQLP
jgi:hypothetical protein